MFKKKSINDIKAPAAAPQSTLVLLRLSETADLALRLYQWHEGKWCQVALDAEFTQAFTPDWVPSENEVELPEINLPEGAKAVLMLPGNWVWSGLETIPKVARRQASAIGYMVEDHLAQDVEGLHFTCKPRAEELCSVYAIDIEKIEALHGQLERLKWPMAAALPEYGMLELLNGDLGLWLDGGQAHIWKGVGQGLTVNRDFLQPLLGSLLSDEDQAEEDSESGNPMDSKTVILLGSGEHDGLIIAELESQFGDGVQVNQRPAEEVFLERFKPGTLTNLLVGDYQLSDGNGTSVWWMRPVKVAAACFVAQLIFFVGAGAYYQWQGNQAESEAQAMFSELFPNTRPSPQLRRQLDGFLKGAGNHGGAFSIQMQQLSQVWIQHKGGALKLQSLRFDGQRGEMVLQLQASNLSDLDAFVSKLSGGGIKADLLGANDLKKGVSGRIRLR
ncbi:type II secretion system protein GspL [Microbulbifer sp. OS29]|uniref:Type II secretion system protein GspL n=1 Tax=Microbulbifer okhotskensis TaxID=2926617 RepID=A0A9X2J5E4_9GAMM|nr:type II secretion system protein GspL [Microbulbifer okhotskensis]MCO1335128.1 type II secretion system protein GspL [Microbulbifer okhotskensis]